MPADPSFSLSETKSDPRIARLLQDCAYLEKSLHLHRPSVANVLKDGRHRLNLLGEWLLGRLLPQPCPQRLRHVTWQIDHPVGTPVMPCGPWISIEGRINDVDGRAPRAVFALVGQRRVEAELKSGKDGRPRFHLHFRSKPGLKFVRLFAELANRIVIPLGYRLAWCGKRWRPHSTRLQPPPAPESIRLRPCPSPRVSIIVPVYNQTAYTLRCLDSIAENTDGDYEVIVMDDCSPEPEIAQLARVPHLRVHRNDSNLGFVRSCNAGAQLARGEFVLFLNNDTEVTPGWLAALLGTFARHPDAGLVGAKLVYPDGSLQEAGGIIWRDGTGWNYGRDDEPEKPEYNYVRRTDYCSGACIILPRELFARLGGFDQRYVPAYCEDSDLAFQVRAAGREVYYQPRAIVVHHEGRSNGTDTAQGVKRYQVVNNAKLVARWHETLQREQGAAPERDLFRARERSLRRKVILFIDHYLPQFDRDAGSRTIFAYVEFFLAAGFSVKFLGDNFAGEEPYLTELQQRGVEVLHGPWFQENWSHWLAQHGAQLDYVLLSRANVSLRYLDAVRRHTRAKLLFYGHDLLSRTLAHQFRLTGERKAGEEAARWLKMEQQVFAQADVVYYPSHEEIRILAREHPQLVARTLPPYVFHSTSPVRYRDHLAARAGVLFVGGFRHLPNVDAMMWFAREVWPQVAAQLPTLKLTIAGAHPPPEICSLAGPLVDVTGYVSDERLHALYRSHRLVIVPLRVGGGIKGKVIEALWHGMPVLTTPVGAEGIPEAETCLRVVPAEDFAASLVALVDSPGQLLALADAGPGVIERHYSPAALHRVFSEHVELPAS